MRFDEIAKEREALHLRPGDGERRFEPPAYPPPSGSLVDDKGVFGREDDKKKVIELLLSDERRCFSVVPIVGMGGLGKTTLAQLIYNDPNISKHFNLQGWVSVSVEFDVPRIMRAIIESISKTSCNLTELSSLQDALKEQVEGKSVLVVLDDVWNEKRSLWESLKVALLGGKWVRIIATTRNDSVAKIMKTVAPYNLDGLSKDQCMLLFQRHAFGAENPEAREKQQLVEIGEKIVKKCAGLPLAVKALACLLGGETDVERWEGVLKSDLWELDQGEDEILPALRLSYHRLPTYLKPCFVYCSMFPKSHRFDKDDLIRQWMAQGYIQLRGSRSPEDTGSDYFDQLLRRSFIQMSPNAGKEERFVIHDLMVDLALSISSEDLRGLTWREARHLYTRYQKELMKSLSSCHNYKPTTLRTLFVPIVPGRYGSWIPAPSLGPLMKLLNLKYLRALSWVKMEWLPDSISSMKHLRYLGLHCTSLDHVLLGSLHQLYSLQTLDLRIDHSKVPLEGIGPLASLRYLRICNSTFYRIKNLVESFCQLHNLWTLDLTDSKMVVLPTGLGDLINLRHLFLPFNYYRTHESIGKLTNLRSLSGFKVTTCTGIGDLKGMADLGGNLIIRGLENVGSAAEARQADLKSKHGIKMLTLVWNGAVGDVELEAAVLESLRPHTNLQKLTIEHYRGFRLPSWMADSSFSQLTDLTLWKNQNIAFLPPLGRLPALESLSLYILNGVRCIGHDFSSCLQGENTTTTKASNVGFPSLKRLQFYFMAEWEEWDGVQDGDFPHLESLQIYNCPKLRRLPTVPLLQSSVLDIIECHDLTSIPLQQIC